MAWPAGPAGPAGLFSYRQTAIFNCTISLFMAGDLVTLSFSKAIIHHFVLTVEKKFWNSGLQVGTGCKWLDVLPAFQFRLLVEDQDSERRLSPRLSITSQSADSIMLAGTGQFYCPSLFPKGVVTLETRWTGLVVFFLFDDLFHEWKWNQSWYVVLARPSVEAVTKSLDYYFNL